MGKGDKYRPVDKKKYDVNYDRICKCHIKGKSRISQELKVTSGNQKGNGRK